jgi:predicted dinucleotide-utilizing enzyme
MTPATNVQTKNPVPNDLRVKSMIALIDELISVVAGENFELAKGLPASRVAQVDEKNRLADLFGQCVAECASMPAHLHVQDRILSEELMEKILSLRAVSEENMMRLRAAIEASNRRIEAVMQAIREQIASVSPYGSGGRRTTRALSCSTNVRA